MLKTTTSRDSIASETRRSSIAQRASNAVRSTIDSVGEKIEQGTLGGTVLNTLCNVIGAGVLSMSYAMFNASLSIGLFLMLYSTICSAIGAYIMVRSCDDTGQFSMTSVLAFALYPKVSRAEYRKKRAVENHVDLQSPMSDSELEEHERAEVVKARKRDYVEVFMNVMTFFYNYGTLIVYGRVIADSIPPVIENFLHGGGFWVQRYAWLLLGGAVFFVLSCARHMEELKWTSLMGFVTILYIVVIVFVRYITNESHPIYPNRDLETHNVHWWKLSMKSFNAITTFGLAYCYHYNVPYFYKELNERTPKRFMVSVAICLPITIVCYIVVGVFGYLTFGSLAGDEEAGGNIVNNYPVDDVAVNIGRLGLFLHFVAVYPILAVSCRRNLHRLLFRFVLDQRKPEERVALLVGDDLTNETEEVDGLNDPAENPTRCQIVSEAFFLVSTSAVISYFVPGVGVVVEVSGCLFGLFLMFIVPGMVGLCIFSGNFVSKAMKDDGEFEIGRFADPHQKRFWRLALFQLISGVVFYIAGITSLAYGFATGTATGGSG